MPAALHAPAVPALTAANWLETWHADLPMLTLSALLAAAYLLGCRSVRRRGHIWPAGRTAWFILGGVGSLLLCTTSFLGAYNRALFWAGAAENVLLVGAVPVAFTMGRPLELAQRVAAGRVRQPRSLALVARVLGFPLVGTAVAVGLLLALYTTGYDEATLRHPALLALLHVELLGAGCLFSWPLLGVDAWSARLSYPVRAGITFVDGLLDALPGLAVLASRGLIAGSYYRDVGRRWGPSLQGDQRLAGTAIVALAELVALPSVVVLLVQWARTDRLQAEELDAQLDARAAVRRSGLVDALDLEAAGLERPWWETDPGPLAERARRGRWAGPSAPEDGP